MSDVFVSYRKDDVALARRLVDALAAQGLSVWWDESLTSRTTWDAEIERAIAAAATVLVLWTPRSVVSDWVRTEAHYGQDHGKLIPVMGERCTIPLAFTLRQTLDLTDWHDDPEHRHWRKLLAWIADLSASRQPGAAHGGSGVRPNAFRRAVGQTPHGDAIEDGAFVTAATPTGTIFRDGDALPLLRIVPAGAFVIGSVPGDPDRTPCEGPQKRIEIPAPFAIGLFPVLQGELDALLATRPAAPVTARPAVATMPATHVSFDDADALATALSARTGEHYRVPSETEWEYACRAGSRTRYAPGDTIDATLAAFDLPSGPLETGRYRPNAFGLYDMHGNVREWTTDLWHESYDDTPTDGTPALEGHGSMRVVRGGGWSDAAPVLRSSARMRATQSLRSPFIGVRVVRVLR